MKSLEVGAEAVDDEIEGRLVLHMVARGPIGDVEVRER